MSGARSEPMKTNRDQAMAHSNPRSRTAKPLLVAASLAVAILSGCAGPRDQLTTGGIPDDYRERHPIVVAETEQTVDIPVASTDRRLTIAQRELIRGFATNYVSRASGPVYILSPEGSANAGAARALRSQVRAELASRGIASNKIINTTYAATGLLDAAPIRLSFTGMTAVTTRCGQWPKDISADFTNQNYYNFGCASQNNLAAQVANPEDFVAPRGMTPIDAERRNEAIKEYRTTTSTIEEIDSGQTGF
ncbi:CpaD family pilus assembly protein [Rhizobium mesosinicum]|uniref:CpaD family pilus assembly protein n=1 Tax=Rhizobium mesosinicum TaxID=335017 RepID=A0ABS7GQE8_9HYPH|nr:CpaD family pilus assembly protein [Rhizobium mesosinicum]MBW9052143.1 CpaD family pilus assembly protein [Rhizobium mesosinicum]